MDFTTWFVIVGTALILMVDLILKIKKGSAATISDHMRSWSHKWPIVAFLVGFLIGHLYGN